MVQRKGPKGSKTKLTDAAKAGQKSPGGRHNLQGKIGEQWLACWRKKKNCKFSDIKDMDKDDIRCSAKDQKMPKLSSQMVQKECKNVEEEDTTCRGRYESHGIDIETKKNKIFTKLKAIQRHGMLSSAGTGSKDCPTECH